MSVTLDLCAQLQQIPSPICSRLLEPLLFNNYVHAHIITDIHICMHIHTYLHMCACIHIIACMHACIVTHTYVRTYINKYIHAYIHTCMHACMHTHTYTHTHIHTYTHTYIHIHTLLLPFAAKSLLRSAQYWRSYAAQKHKTQRELLRCIKRDAVHHL